MDETESFEARIYRDMKQINPRMTTRQFSVALGKAKSYYSSVTAQKLEISLDSIVKLNDHLECKKVLLGDNASEGISKLQQTLATEVISRIRRKTEASGDFWNVIVTQVNDQASMSKQQAEPLPFSWTRY